MIKKALIIAALTLPSFAYADSQVFPLPTDNKLVEFIHDKHNTYPVLTQDLHVTDIEFGEDETIVGHSIGDSIYWKIDAGGDRHLFIKPVKPNVETSLSVITSKRSYQITLRSSPEGGKWYQHVSWVYPDVATKMYASYKKSVEANEKEVNRLNEQVVVDNVSLDDLNTDYSYTGDKTLKPLMVGDDGKRTWIKFESMTEVPLVFIDDGDSKKFAMVNIDGPKNNTIILQRIARQIVVKLGKAEGRITKK